MVIHTVFLLVLYQHYGKIIVIYNKDMTKITYKGKKITENGMERWLEWPMLALTILLLPILAIPALYNVSPSWRNAFELGGAVIWVAFYIEIFLKLLVSDNMLRTLGRNWFLIIILLSPFLLAFRLIRLVRFVSVLRFLRLQSLLRHVKKSVATFIYNLEYVVLAFVVFVFIASLIMWQIEAQLGGAIDTFGDALWWSVITVTTIGYGDIIPQTAAGRLAGSIISLIGILLFMVVVARTTAFFVADTKTNKK